MKEAIYRPLSVGVKKVWTSDEQRYILAHHKDMCIEDIAKYVGKTVSACKNKANKMGCKVKTKKGNKI